MKKEEIDEFKKAAQKLKANHMITGHQHYCELLRLWKPSVWLLHGYYPGGRNDPAPTSPPDTPQP